MFGFFLCFEFVWIQKLQRFIFFWMEIIPMNCFVGLSNDLVCHLFFFLSLPDVSRMARTCKGIRQVVEGCDPYWSRFLGTHPMRVDQHEDGCFRWTCFRFVYSEKDLICLWLHQVVNDEGKVYFLHKMLRACTGDEHALVEYRGLCLRQRILDPSFYPAFPARSNGRPFDFLHTLDMIREAYVNYFRLFGLSCRDPAHFRKSLWDPLAFENFCIRKNAYHCWKRKCSPRP